jgi:TonB family protein
MRGKVDPSERVLSKKAMSPNNPTFDSAESHLNRLLAQQVEQPWFRTFWQNIKETIRPPKLPPLEVTSKPVAVKDIWGFSGGQEKSAGITSLAIHVGVVALLLVVGTNERVQEAAKQAVNLVAPDLSPYIPQAPPKPKTMGGGGGGGDRSPLPASKGKLPRVAPRQFTPPMAVVNNPNPKLIMEPTIVVQPNAQLPQVNMAQFGDPLGRIGPPSNGTGSGGGIGSGSGGGVGSGRGPGVGPGEGGGIGGGVYRIGGGVSAPTLLFKVEPEYSEEARKAKFQGTVVLYVVVDEKGNPQQLRVVRPLGLGLDEKAIEAVQKWRFKPGYKDGRAVAVAATVEVNFRLL